MRSSNAWCDDDIEYSIPGVHNARRPRKAYVPLLRRKMGETYEEKMAKVGASRRGMAAAATLAARTAAREAGAARAGSEFGSV